MTGWEGLNPPYRTIVADPPWPSNGTAFIAVPTRVGRVIKDRRPESQYSTLDIASICAMPVADLAEKNAHLYLWATCSGLDVGLAVMEAWGFTYKTTLTWIKEGHLGLGSYFRTQTEHVLFGVRGSLSTLDRSQITHFSAPKRGHSIKPPAFGDIVEKCSPGLDLCDDCYHDITGVAQRGEVAA